MKSLASAILASRSIDLCIVYGSPKIKNILNIEDNGVTYYAFPAIHAYKEKKPARFSTELRYCQHIITDYNPDVIHIHGTENFYGLIVQITKIPIIVSIQGIVNEYKRHYFGNLSFFQVIRNPSLIRQYLNFTKRCPMEIMFVKRLNNFFGRTYWDKCFLKSINQTCKYYHEDRILRAIFYQQAWEYQSCKKFQINCTSSETPYKGLDVIIFA